MAEKNGSSPMIVVDKSDTAAGSVSEHHGILKKRGRKLKPDEKLLHTIILL